METTKYARIGEAVEAAPSLRHSLWVRRALQAFGLFILAALAFAAGRTSAYRDLHSEVPLGYHSQLYAYNRTFSEKPSNRTNQAWAEIFPKQRGFFKHPELAPERSALSVFHLLHCVDGIRHGYWRVLDAALAGEKINEDNIPFMASPKHIRHCIDLLRNNLMCYPDTTIEVLDKEAGGVTGFGTMHKCRNWNELLDWTSKWQTYNQDKKPDKAEVQNATVGAHDQHH